MRPAGTFLGRPGKPGFAPRRNGCDQVRSSLVCACGFALLGMVLSLSVILGPPGLELRVACEFAMILFITGSIGLGFALAASLAGR